MNHTAIETTIERNTPTVPTKHKLPVSDDQYCLVFSCCEKIHLIRDDSLELI